MKEKKNYAKPLQALFSLLGLILLLVWMQGGFTSKTPPGTVQAAEDREAARAAPKAAPVERREIDEIMRWPATVTARSVAQVASKVPARVIALNVKAGDAVKAGQPIARLDSSELQSRVNQARSTLAQAEAQAAKAAAELRRVESLYGQEAATPRQLESAQAAARASGAQVAEARAAIGAADSLLMETELRAPFDGAVVRRNLEPGDMAMPGAPVVTIQSGQRLRVEVDIPESCAGRVRLNDRLTAWIGEKSYDAKVEAIAPAADPHTRTVLVKAGLENQGAAQPGAFAWIEQSCGSRAALLIPQAAVSRSGQLESVRLLAGGKTLLRHVRTGKAHDGRVEVLSGLKEGDTVLLGDAP